MVAPRPPGRSGRLHTDATFAAVRRLIEQSTLSYGQIKARTGVSHASICRWARDGGWKRPPFAPRANDMIPAPRASAQLRRRTLAARLDALAERHIRELEESACVDPVKLGEALELLKMAKLAARRRPRRRLGDLAEPEEFARPIIQLCAAGVDLSRAPRAAVEDFLANRERPPKETLPPKGRGSQARMGALVDEGEGGIVARMERSEIRGGFVLREKPGLRCAPCGQHLQLVVRRRLEAPAVCAALERHGADRAREGEGQAAHARGAPRRARRAPYPGDRGERARRSRQARRGVGASRRWRSSPPDGGRSAGRASLRPNRRRGRWGSLASRTWTSPAPHARRSTTSSPTANGRPKEAMPPRGSRGSRRAREHAVDDREGAVMYARLPPASLRGAKRRSNPERAKIAGLLRFARNDGGGTWRESFPREERSRMKKGSITRFKLNAKKPPKSDWRAFDAMSEADSPPGRACGRGRSAGDQGAACPRAPRAERARAASEAEPDAGRVRGPLSPAARDRAGLGARRPSPRQGRAGVVDRHCERPGGGGTRAERLAGGKPSVARMERSGMRERYCDRTANPRISLRSIRATLA